MEYELGFGFAVVLNRFCWLLNHVKFSGVGSSVFAISFMHLRCCLLSKIRFNKWRCFNPVVAQMKELKVCIMFASHNVYSFSGVWIFSIIFYAHLSSYSQLFSMAIRILGIGAKRSLLFDTLQYEMMGVLL